MRGHEIFTVFHILTECYSQIANNIVSFSRSANLAVKRYRGREKIDHQSGVTSSGEEFGKDAMRLVVLVDIEANYGTNISQLFPWLVMLIAQTQSGPATTAKLSKYQSFELVMSGCFPTLTALLC